jgi:Uma2 family endonuclease
MIAALPKSIRTPAELLEMPDGAGYELVDSRLVERNASTLSSLVEGLVYEKVQAHNRQGSHGIVWPGTLGIQCFPDQPGKVRRPDLTFVKAERFTLELLNTGFLPLAPDLAVEVISPGDLAHEVSEKIEEYLHAGVSLIWVVDPEIRIVDVYRKNGEISRLREADELLGHDVLPNFRCRVADLFPTKGADIIAP